MTFSNILELSTRNKIIANLDCCNVLLASIIDVRPKFGDNCAEFSTEDAAFELEL
jgi:hypothetical protein